MDARASNIIRFIDGTDKNFIILFIKDLIAGKERIVNNYLKI